MADDPHNTSDISDVAEPTAPANEDAETTAARRELKQTSISEKTGTVRRQQDDDDKSGSDEDAPKRKKPARRLTPPTALSAPREDEFKEQVSSPKKKRAHDELDESKDNSADGSVEKADSGTPTGSQSRTDRSEPEKKRPRDRQASASFEKSGKEEVEPLSASASPRSSMDAARPKESLDASLKTSKGNESLLKPASSSAFANSTFGKLASSSVSPFATVAGAGQPSLFGSSSSSGSSSIFGGGSSTTTKPTNPTGPPKLSFGSASGASPFATAAAPANGQAGGSIFKTSAFASPFGASALSGSRLTFGKPGEALKSDKPAKPFGAPDSDAEEGSGEESGGEDGDEAKGDGSSDEGGAKDEKEEARAGEDKKKPKLQKVHIDDGESEEVTLLSVRAKIYVMEKEAGWKERGAGMLKVNVPKATVEFDETTGAPDPTSFDASVLADEKDELRKHVRLIMRQDHTLRVILNTVLLPAMKFQVMSRLKASTVLFTAFEEGVGRQVQVKMSDANAIAFSSLVEMLKKRLADV